MFVRQLDGQITVVNDQWAHTDASGTTCVPTPGRPCPHGYRVDEMEARLSGDGQRVVAMHGRSRAALGADLRDLPQDLALELARLEPGAQVEVLLDDGRVVVSTTRSAPWAVGGDSHLIRLDGFVGGFNLARLRPAGFTGWLCRLDAADAR